MLAAMRAPKKICELVPVPCISLQLDVASPSVPRPSYLGVNENSQKMNGKSLSKHEHLPINEDIGKKEKQQGLLVPPLSFPSSEKPAVERNRSVREVSERSAHVQALRGALRPVRLQRPTHLLSDPDGSDHHYPIPVSTPQLIHQREEEMRRDSLHLSEQTDMERSENADEDEEKRGGVRAREFVAQLWEGYALEYPGGKSGTPKWQKMHQTGPGPGPGPGLRHNGTKQPGKRAWTKSLDSPRSSSPKQSSSTEPCGMSERTASKHLSRPSLSIRADTAAIEKKCGADKRIPVVQLQPIKKSARHEKIDEKKKEDENNEEDVSSEKTWTIEKVPDPLPRRRSRAVAPLPVQSQTGPSRSAFAGLRARSLDRLRAEKVEKEMSDLAELKKQFRANPLPDWINQITYSDLTRQAEERKAQVEERAKAMLEQTKPFAFDITRGERRRVKSDAGHGGVRKTDAFIKHKTAKAQPLTAYPATLQQRIQDHLRSTKPTNTACHKHVADVPCFQPSINPRVPDFGRLHAALERRREMLRLDKPPSTVPHPFKMHFLQSHTKPSQISPSSRRSLSADRATASGKKRLLTDDRPFQEIVRPTRAFLLMSNLSRLKQEEEKCNQIGLEKDDSLVERVRISLMERDNQVQMQHDNHNRTRQVLAEKQQQERDYLDRLTQVKRRLNDRPFIWQTSLMDQRKRRIEDTFQQILQQDHLLIDHLLLPSNPANPQ